MKQAVRSGRQGIQSVVVGSRLLEALARGNRSMPLTHLAQEAAMPPAKAHRYLAGYISAGLVKQDPATGRYDLGPLALDVGLAALRRLDIVEIAHPVLIGLRDEISETVSMTVWGNRGPTLVRWVPSAAPVSITVNVGSVLPLVTSSSGRVFAAFLASEITDPMIKLEISQRHGVAQRAGFGSRKNVDRLLGEVRRSGLSQVDGLVLPGICSVSAPIFNHAGAIVAAMAVVGISGMMDISLDARPAQCLRRTAQALSAQMGYSTGAT